MVDGAAGDEQPDREEQRVAGQDREEPALGEHDEGDSPEHVGSEEVDQILRVHPGRQQHRDEQGNN